MFEVGHVFNKNGYNFCVLDVLNFNLKNYLLVSVEKDKLEYLFYELVQTANGYKLHQVVDNELSFALFELVENKIDKE